MQQQAHQHDTKPQTRHQQGEGQAVGELPHHAQVGTRLVGDVLLAAAAAAGDGAHRRAEGAAAHALARVAQNCASQEQEHGVETVAHGAAEDAEPVNDEALEMLKAGAALVYDRQLVSQQLAVTYTIRAKIARNTKGNLTIERKDTSSSKLEV